MASKPRAWLLGTDAALYFAAVVIATIAAWFALDLWTMRWDVPLVYSGDGLAVGAHFKTVIETGWYEWQPALGAPYGQVYHDYPAAENLHFMAAWLFGTLGAGWGAAVNIHFVLGFPLAAAAMVWFLRRVGISPVLTVVMSVLFAITPYHFARGEGHLFLSWYWVVPLGLGLVWSILRGQPVWGARPGVRRGLGHLMGRTGGTVAILVLLGTASTYYSAFTLLLGGIAAIAAVWIGRDWRRFWGAVSAAALLGSVLIANLLPDIAYRLTAGANPGALQRTPVETEIYALKLSQLLLPASFHRFGPFRYLREQYDLHYPLPSEGPALGLVAAVGLIALVVAMFFALAHNAQCSPRPQGPLMTRLAPLSFLALVAFLFATVGGLSTLISFAWTTLRAWNRISIVIAALCLAAVAILLDALVSRVVRTRRLGPVAATAVAAAIAVPLAGVGYWDQTPPVDRAARASVVADFDSDAAFAATLESALPEGATLFQLPYIDFPESPPQNGALDSDQLRPYLHSQDLGFSGGGIRGRPSIDRLADIAATAEVDAATFVAEARSLGFDGVIMDSLAFGDSVDVSELAVELGGMPATSANGRFVFVEFED